VIDRLVIATKNPDKVVEVEAVLARDLPGLEVVGGLDWPDVAETGSTLLENARLKAGVVRSATSIPALADDTGLEVDALDGAPGVHTARLAGEGAGYEANRRALLQALEGVEDRSARFRTVIVLVFDGGEVIAEGVLEGSIAREERGDLGFGYDPIFALSDGRTLAEVPTDEKNLISHRALALSALVERLRTGAAPPSA